MNILFKFLWGGFGIKLKQLPRESSSDPYPLYGGICISYFWYLALDSSIGTCVTPNLGNLGAVNLRVLVEFLGEVVTVVYQARSVVNHDRVSTNQVFGFIVIFFFETHSLLGLVPYEKKNYWVMGQERGLGQLASSEQQRERVFTIILFSDLLDLNRAIGQEII